MPASASTKRRRWMWVAAALFVAASSGALRGSAAEPRGEPSLRDAPKMLIEPGELEKKLDQQELRIVDTRSQSEYAKQHIPGAVRSEVKGWQALGRKEGGFHDAKAWGEKVGELGISQDSHVVVYGSAPTDTARVWWTLKYLGHQNVSILNGGWAQGEAAYRDFLPDH